MCGMRIFAGHPIYHLPVNFISVTVGLVYINLQPEYELPTSTRFGQFQKLELGAPSSPATPKETVSARGPSSCS